MLALLPNADSVIHAEHGSYTIVLGARAILEMPELAEITKLGAKTEAFRHSDFGTETATNICATYPLGKELYSILRCAQLSPLEASDEGEVRPNAIMLDRKEDPRSRSSLVQVSRPGDVAQFSFRADVVEFHEQRQAAAEVESCTPSDDRPRSTSVAYFGIVPALNEDVALSNFGCQQMGRNNPKE